MLGGLVGAGGGGDGHCSERARVFYIASQSWRITLSQPRKRRYHKITVPCQNPDRAAVRRSQAAKRRSQALKDNPNPNTAVDSDVPDFDGLPKRTYNVNTEQEPENAILNGRFLLKATDAAVFRI